MEADAKLEGLVLDAYRMEAQLRNLEYILKNLNFDFPLGSTNP